MCTRHYFDLYQGTPSDYCAQCLDPEKRGILPYKSEGYIVRVCLDCHERIALRRLLDNFHPMEPVHTVEVYA